jgi:hypothetical protein
MMMGFILATIFWRLDDTPQGRVGAAGLLRHGHVVHNVLLRVRRRTAGVRAGAPHLPARDCAQRLPPLLIRVAGTSSSSGTKGGDGEPVCGAGAL